MSRAPRCWPWPAGRRSGPSLRDRERHRAGVRVVRGDRRRSRRRRALHRHAASAAPPDCPGRDRGGQGRAGREDVHGDGRRGRGRDRQRAAAPGLRHGGDVDPVPAGHRRGPPADRRRSDRRGAAGPGRSRRRPALRHDRPAVRPGARRRGDARSRGLRRLLRPVLPRPPRSGRGDGSSGPDRGRPGGRPVARVRRRPRRLAADLLAPPDPRSGADPRHRRLDRGAAAVPPPQHRSSWGGPATSPRRSCSRRSAPATPTS